MIVEQFDQTPVTHFVEALKMTLEYDDVTINYGHGAMARVQVPGNSHIKYTLQLTSGVAPDVHPRTIADQLAKKLPAHITVWGQETIETNVRVYDKSYSVIRMTLVRKAVKVPDVPSH